MLLLCGRLQVMLGPSQVCLPFHLRPPISVAPFGFVKPLAPRVVPHPGFPSLPNLKEPLGDVGPYFIFPVTWVEPPSHFSFLSLLML